MISKLISYKPKVFNFILQLLKNRINCILEQGIDFMKFGHTLWQTSGVKSIAFKQEFSLTGN